MRIGLNVEKRKSDHSKVIQLTLPTFLKYKRGFGSVKFVIDTGSSTSLISEKSARKINAPLSRNMKPDKFSYGIIGKKLNLKRLKNVKLLVRNNEEKLVKLKPKKFYFGFSSSGRTMTTANLLGMDFLEEHNLRLFVDVKNNEAYLED